MKHTKKAHQEELSAIMKLAFSCDGKILALARRNRTIELWSTVTNDILRCIINSYSRHPAIMVFSPEDTSIVSYEFHGNKIKFWDPVKGNLQYTIDDEELVSSLGFSPDGKVLAICKSRGRVNLWDFTSGLILQTFGGVRADCLAFSSNGQLLALGSHLLDIIRLWNLSTGNLQQIRRIDRSLQRLWFHPEKPYLFSNKGIMEIPEAQANVSSQPCSGDFVFRINDWILWNEERVLLLPVEYREQSFDCRDKILAIGQDSGLVSLIEIDFPPENRIINVFSSASSGLGGGRRPPWPLIPPKEEDRKERQDEWIEKGWLPPEPPRPPKLDEGEDLPLFSRFSVGDPSRVLNPDPRIAWKERLTNI